MTKQQKNWVITGGLILVIFTITYTILLVFGLTPQQFQSDATPNIFQIQGDYVEYTQPVDTVIDTNIIPQKISIPKIGVSSTIQVPNGVDVATLDAALQRGAVYYPGSGTLQRGNMFLFGHSTNWRVVNNQAYQTFNNLEKLSQGDEVILISDGVQYIYKVQTVTRASEEDVLIQFDKGERMLTISTCDTFGRKQDRWVVEAIFDRSV